MASVLDKDQRDPVKRELGLKLMSMKETLSEEDFLRFLVSLELSEKEIMEITHDPEYWLRDNQFIPLGMDDEPITILLAGRGFGKAVSKNHSHLLTQNKGWITVGEAEVGDTVFDEKGNPCRILAIHEPEEELWYELEFDGGEKIIAGGDHNWVTWTHQARKCWGRNIGAKYPENWVNWSFTNPTKKNAEPIGPKKVTTQEIVETFTHGKRGDLNHSIPLPFPLKMEEQELPLHPYLLGCWLGDGSKSDGNVAGIDQSIFMRLSMLGYDVNFETKANCRVYIRGITKDLRKLGILKNKHVPEIYLHNSIENRLELLRGLMDTDGYSGDAGKNSNKECNVEFCNTNKNLAEAVLFLVTSLGEKASMIEGRATLNGKDYGPKYRVTWKPNHYNPFWTKYKTDIVDAYLSDETLGQSNRTRQRMIKSFKRVPKPEGGGRCFSVSSPSNLFLVGKSLIPTHNSYSIAAAVYRAVEEKGIKSILLVSRTVRDLRSVVVPAIEQFWYDGHPNKPTFNKNNGEMKWPNGAEALCVAAESGEDAVRGQNVELFICDEFAFYGNNEGIITQGLLALRKGISKFIGATTPFASPRLIEWVNMYRDGDSAVKIITGSTRENARNLSKTFLKETVEKLEGTILGRQEIDGELILQNPAALWQMPVIEENLIREKDLPPMKKISIGLDPAILSQKSAVGKKSGRTPDSTGIVITGRCENGLMYIMRDLTGSYTTEQWVKKSIELYDYYKNEVDEVKLCIEVNTIGEETLQYYYKQQKRLDVFKHVICTYSTQSKLQRAQPYALLTEQGKVKFVNSKNLDKLINEMTTYSGSGKSPNHLDAFTQSCIGNTPMKKNVTKHNELIV